MSNVFGTFHSFWLFLGQLLEFFDIFLQHLPSFWNFCHFLELLVCFPFLKCFLETFATFQNFWFLLGKIKKWCNGLSAEGAKADVLSVLHSPDDPPFFVFLSFSCIYVCCGSMCSLGSMWAQQSYSAVLHLHLWWYYLHLSLNGILIWGLEVKVVSMGKRRTCEWHEDLFYSFWGLWVIISIKRPKRFKFRHYTFCNIIVH